MAELLNLRGYQEEAAAREVELPRMYHAADPGLGKTSTALEAFVRLREYLDVRRMLVVAPLRVARSTWPAEVEKWSRFAGLKVELLCRTGKTRDDTAKLRRDAMARDADIYVGTPDMMVWLAQEVRRGWDLKPEMLVLDEATKYKTPGARRTAAAWNLGKRFARRYALSGTPAPNGYGDLFAQVRILDDGASLGRDVKGFRKRYFAPIIGQGGRVQSWELRSGGAEEIQKAVGRLFLRQDAEDLLDLPELVEVQVPVELPPHARALYEKLRKELVLRLGQGDVTVANAAALSAKCRQITGGHVYLDDLPGAAPRRPDGNVRGRDYAAVHRAKLEAVMDTVTELAGKPALILYEFAHDGAELTRVFGNPPNLTLAADEIEQREMEDEWNRGAFPVMLAQVETIAHGLNLQHGSNRLLFYTLPWNLETYLQALARLRRQGQTASRVLAYHFNVADSVDLAVSGALRAKKASQDEFLEAIKETL